MALERGNDKLLLKVLPRKLQIFTQAEAKKQDKPEGTKIFCIRYQINKMSAEKASYGSVI